VTLREPMRQRGNDGPRFDAQIDLTEQHALSACGAAPRRARASAPSSHAQPSAISVWRKASRTAHASGRGATMAGPCCSIAMPAAPATSLLTSRERRARRQIRPCSCPSP
jgi:hypothetical protein